MRGPFGLLFFMKNIKTIFATGRVDHLFSIPDYKRLIKMRSASHLAGVGKSNNVELHKKVLEENISHFSSYIVILELP